MREKYFISKIIFKKAYLFIGFFCFIFINSYSQDQKKIDSLENIYNKKEYNEHEELKLLRNLSLSETNADKSLFYSLKLIEAAKKYDSINYLYSGYLQKGNALRLKSDLTEALESLFKAAKISNEKKFKQDRGGVNIAIADVYSTIGDHNNAILYYKRGLLIINDSISLASAQFNLGDEYYNQNKLDSAQYYYNKSGKIFRYLKFDTGIAYNIGNEGLIYTKKNEYKKAEKNLKKAIQMLTKLGDYSPICDYLASLSDIYAKRNNNKKAIIYALKSFNIAKKHGFKDQISKASLKLSTLYEKDGNTRKSFRYYKNYIIYKDSIENLKAVQLRANIRTKYEISQKQIEVNLLNQQKKTQKIIVLATGIALLLIIILAVGLFKRTQFMHKANKIIESEKSRSDNLLRNILPAEIAKELIEKGSVKAKKFESVSVLFTDFKGFTKSSENLTPEKLVESVDFYFSKFDEIIEKYNLEKIKTVGDAYMCASGLPFYTENHTARLVEAAQEILQFVEDTKANKSNDLTHFDVRIGINSGPVVAGVVGIKKFSYDIWGDTVNVASRMESASEVGKINISETTRNIIRGYFKCTYRGEIEVKNRGAMNMYYVTEKI